jgi:hypothetical protein
MKACGPALPPLWEVQPGHAARCWLHHEDAAAQRPVKLFRGETMPRGTAA